mmetsp:Transcript_32046/g.91393  ORF Transcript_32046/g.91393 Transcript_32046/m.91393 type:complete len:454 (-) Transcript_32046:191-1552(-)
MSKALCHPSRRATGSSPRLGLRHADLQLRPEVCHGIELQLLPHRPIAELQLPLLCDSGALHRLSPLLASEEAVRLLVVHNELQALCSGTPLDRIFRHHLPQQALDRCGQRLHQRILRNVKPVQNAQDPLHAVLNANVRLIEDRLHLHDRLWHVPASDHEGQDQPQRIDVVLVRLLRMPWVPNALLHETRPQLRGRIDEGAHVALACELVIAVGLAQPPEVAIFDTVDLDKDVLRLDISVDEAEVVRSLQTAQQIDDHLHRLRFVQPAVLLDGVKHSHRCTLHQDHVGALVPHEVGSIGAVVKINEELRVSEVLHRLDLELEDVSSDRGLEDLDGKLRHPMLRLHIDVARRALSDGLELLDRAERVPFGGKVRQRKRARFVSLPLYVLRREVRPAGRLQRAFGHRGYRLGRCWHGRPYSIEVPPKSSAASFDKGIVYSATVRMNALSDAIAPPN